MVSSRITVNGKNVWLIFESLYYYADRKLVGSDSFLCYYSLSLPIQIPYGELIMDAKDTPKVFYDEEEAHLFAINYLKDRIRFDREKDKN